MENKIYTFDDLVFQPHPNGLNGKQARLDLNNGRSVSVVFGPGLYGDGVETFEIAAFDSSGKFIRLGEYDDVLGWRTAAEITEIMAGLQG
jgi:hypothetical protein